MAPLLCPGSICVLPDAGVVSKSLKFCTVVKPFGVNVSTGSLDCVLVDLKLLNVTAEFDCVESKL